jgi:DNA-directed RNA polymerase specialized sigma24 family protein
MSGKHTKGEGNPDATRYCADDETLVRVLEAARTSAGAIAHRVVRNWHTAEDVVQEALLRAVVAQDHLQEIDNREAWLVFIWQHGTL